jgi:hypothetical protein
MKKDPFRLNCEGVIQETLASSTVERFFCGTIVTIGAQLKMKDKKLVKKYIDGEENFQPIDSWPKRSKEEREAILVAICSLSGEKLR